MIVGGGRQYWQDNTRVLETFTALKELFDCRALFATTMPNPLLRYKEQPQRLRFSKLTPSVPQAGLCLAPRHHSGFDARFKLRLL